MKPYCIVNTAIGSWHPAGQDRLIASVNAHNSDIDCVVFRDAYPPNSPTHKEVPYAFKPYAVLSAMSMGYKYILWLDAAVVVRKNLAPLWEYIKENGHYLQDNAGWNTGQWCTDAALTTLGMTREEAFKTPHLMACIMGFDVSNTRTAKFIEDWVNKSKDGVSFLGAWTNTNGEVSKDKRVLGHRHDQTVASVLSSRLGMKWASIYESKLFYGPPTMPIPDYVLFTSQGGL